MKRILLVLMSLASAASAGAQSRDSSGTSDGPVANTTEFRLGATYSSGERNYAFGGAVNATSGSIQGIELLARRGLVGATVRTLDGKFGNQFEVVNADVTALLGPPVLNLQVGYARRATVGQFATQLYTFARVGGQGNFRVGGSGLRASIGAWDYLPMGDSQDRMKSGVEGETQVIYAFQDKPFYLLAGYRSELFTARTGTGASDGSTPEEVHGIRIGAGWQVGGH